MVARRSIALAALFLCVGVGCSSSAKPPACGTRDAGVIEVGLEPPPGCPPAEANELGIGKPCTMCGNECASPLRCTCDSYLGVQLSDVGDKCREQKSEQDAAATQQNVLKEFRIMRRAHSPLKDRLRRWDVEE